MRLTLFHVFAFLTLCFGLYNVSGYLVQYFNSSNESPIQEYKTTTGLILSSEAVKTSSIVSEKASEVTSSGVTNNFTITASGNSYGFPKQFAYCYVLNGVQVLNESGSDITFLINNERITISINGIRPFNSDYLFLKFYSNKSNFKLWLCNND